MTFDAAPFQANSTILRSENTLLRSENTFALKANQELFFNISRLFANSLVLFISYSIIAANDLVRASHLSKVYLCAGKNQRLR